LTFHRQLFDAIVPELALQQIASYVRGRSDPLPDLEYWEALAGNAEERGTRVAQSFGVAAVNINEGVMFEMHRRRVNAVMQSFGSAAARREARNYIEAFLYYPRVMLPLLMSEARLPVRPPVELK
jgi:hypothetical protein